MDAMFAVDSCEFASQHPLLYQAQKGHERDESGNRLDRWLLRQNHLKRVQQRVTMQENLSRAGMSALTFSFDGFVFSALARGRKIRGFKALDRAVDWAVMRSPMAAQPYACTLYEDIDIDWINWIKNSRNLHTRAIIRKGSTGSSRIQYAKIYKQSSSACASREPFHQQGVRGPLECFRWANK